ncbi:MAG: response regulator [Candidatus Aminicenantes bacterium]|nr:response regulator [Candidatus Aminicenantes bacterium]NIM83867.1 response regulator [Candidatus Aminicenantes bacterium]NIN23331.1 response regulator [Candidatus Aminicenantes bacterium]NIN47035.1 response regulator [Candidatus Aminicenantes bacterium]NIN89957.1 response regulator [Candidatus Aminicenantes bacterium]
MNKLLVVEDNKSMQEMLESILSEKGYLVKTADDVSDAMLLLKKENFHVIISDLQLPGVDGIEFLKKIKHMNIPFIMLTAFGSIELAVKAMKQGAFDFVSKPVDPDYLFLIVEKALESTRILRENIIFKEIYESELEKSVIIGSSPSILREAEKLKQVAGTETPVLLLGESGTGKELFARAIHNLSARKEKPFVAINSASIPENLLENELFGHEKGAYTDAYVRQIGKLELTQGGTFFLDEIGDLSLNLQGKILRVIEEKKVSRIGSNQEIDLDIRFIFATNVNLVKAVSESKFRKDLYFRINVFPIQLPPLRDRDGDIILLAEYFVKKFSREMKKGDIFLAEKAKEKLKNYRWPGNIRELLNTIERALILCKDQEITESDIVLPEKPFSLVDDFNFSGSLKQVTARATRMVEKMKIEQTLKDVGFNKTRAAELLTVSYKTLLDKIKEYDIAAED